MKFTHLTSRFGALSLLRMPSLLRLAMVAVSPHCGYLTDDRLIGQPVIIRSSFPAPRSGVSSNPDWNTIQRSLWNDPNSAIQPSFHLAGRPHESCNFGLVLP